MFTPGRIVRPKIKQKNELVCRQSLDDVVGAYWKRPQHCRCKTTFTTKSVRLIPLSSNGGCVHKRRWQPWSRTLTTECCGRRY